MKRTLLEHWRWALGIAAVALVLFALRPPDASGPAWSELVRSGARDDGWSVSPPHRGAEHDVFFEVTRGPSTVEIHVVPRGQWEGVVETRSFGVAYETQRTTASNEASASVVQSLAAELTPRDDGSLDTIDVIPLAPGSPRTTGWFAWPKPLLFAVALMLLMLCLVDTPRFFAALTFVLGLAVRVVALDLPFARDQDVQRVLTGALPLGEILFGRALNDRHPPLWFLVLHVVEIAGTSEAVARFPAALASALLAPAIVWAVLEARRSTRISPALIACALVATFSDALVSASREVSDIPFFSLLIVVLVAMTQRAQRLPTRANMIGLGAAHALVLWTYYTGVFVITAAWLVHLVMVRAPTDTEKRVRRASLIGAALGMPSLLLGLRVAWIDSAARTAAHLHPDIAWGESTPLSMFVASTSQMIGAIGVALLVIALVAGLLRSEASRASLAIALAVACGTAAVTPIVRVQPYYVLAVAPVLLLAAALIPFGDWRTWLAHGGVVIASTMLLARSPPSIVELYVPDPDAVVPAYLERCRAEHVDRIVTVASFDATLVAYYAARAASRPIAWSDVQAHEGWLDAPNLSPRIGTLVQSHGSDPAPGPHAAARLEEWLREGPLAVIARDPFTPSEVNALLERCTLLDRSPSTRLLLCRP